MPETTFSDETVYHFLPEETENEHAASIRYVHKQGHGDKYRQARDVPVTLRKDQSSRLRPHGSEENAKLFKVPSSRSIHHLERNKLDRAGAEPRFGVPKKDDDTEEKKKKDAAALLSRVLRVFFPDGPFMSHVKQLSTQRPSLTPPEVMAQARADLGRGPEPIPQNLTINQFLQLNQLTQQIVLSQLTPDQVQQLYGNVNEARGIQGLPPLITPTADPKVWIEAVDSDDEDEEKQHTELTFEPPPADSEDEDDGSNPVVQEGVPIQEGVSSIYPNLGPDVSTNESKQRSRDAMERAISKYKAAEEKDKDVIRGLVQKLVQELKGIYWLGKEDFYRDLKDRKLLLSSRENSELRRAWGTRVGGNLVGIDWRDLFRMFHAILSEKQREKVGTVGFSYAEGEDLQTLRKFISWLEQKDQEEEEKTMGKGVVQAGRGKGRGSTPWIELVKKVQRERGVSYKEALKLASRIR